MRNFTKKVASLCGLVKKVKEVKVFGKLLLLSIFFEASFIYSAPNSKVSQFFTNFTNCQKIYDEWHNDAKLHFDF